MTVLQFPRPLLRYHYSIHDMLRWTYGLSYPLLGREWLSGGDYAYSVQSKDGRRHKRVEGVYQYHNDGRCMWEERQTG